MTLAHIWLCNKLEGRENHLNYATNAFHSSQEKIIINQTILFFRSSWGPMGILHLTLIMCCVQMILYIFMWTLSRKGSLFPKKLFLLTLKSMIFQFCKELSARSGNFHWDLRYKFWRTFFTCSHNKKCAKIWISMKISILGQKVCWRIRKWYFLRSKEKPFSKISYLWTSSIQW